MRNINALALAEHNLLSVYTDDQLKNLIIKTFMKSKFAAKFTRKIFLVGHLKQFVTFKQLSEIQQTKTMFQCFYRW